MSEEIPIPNTKVSIISSQSIRMEVDIKTIYCNNGEGNYEVYYEIVKNMGEEEYNKLLSLEMDIKENGVKEGLKVIPHLDDFGTSFFTDDKKKYLLIDGHHRYYVCMKLGIKTVPIIIPSLKELYLIIWLQKYRKEEDVHT